MAIPHYNLCPQLHRGQKVRLNYAFDTLVIKDGRGWDNYLWEDYLEQQSLTLIQHITYPTEDALEHRWDDSYKYHGLKSLTVPAFTEFLEAMTEIEHAYYEARGGRRPQRRGTMWQWPSQADRGPKDWVKILVLEKDDFARKFGVRCLRRQFYDNRKAFYNVTRWLS